MAAIVGIGLMAALVWRNLAVENPLMYGDEYAYFAAAEQFPDAAERFAADPYLPRVHSPVFAAIGHAWIAWTSRPQVLQRLFNTLLFAAALVVFLRLARRLRGAPVPPMWLAVLVLLPFSSYTAYFMPETTYLFLFALLAAVLSMGLAARLVTGAMLSGVIAGTMLLVKPHAIAVLLALLSSIALLAVAPPALRPRRRHVVSGMALCALSAYGTLVVMNALLTGQLRFDPFLFVGNVYHGYLAEGLSPSVWLERVALQLGILFGHLVILSALLAPAIAVAVAELRRQAAAEPTGIEAGRARERFLLVCFTLLVTVFAVAMMTNFSASVVQTEPHQTLRLHGRYYSFVFPLYVVLFAGLADRAGATTGAWIRWGAIAGLIAALVLYDLQGRSLIYPFDYPEAFAFSSWPREPVGSLGAAAAYTPAAITLLAAGYAIMLWKEHSRRVVYGWLLIVVFAFANVRVTAWQRASTADHAGLLADVRTMQRLIPPEDRDRGLVVGSAWNGAIAYFMFHFRSSAHVLVRQRDIPLTRSDLPREARWVILLDRYQHDMPGTTWVETPRLTAVRIEPRRRRAASPPAMPPASAAQGVR